MTDVVTPMEAGPSTSGTSSNANQPSKRDNLPW